MMICSVPPLTSSVWALPRILDDSPAGLEVKLRIPSPSGDDPSGGKVGALDEFREISSSGKDRAGR